MSQNIVSGYPNPGEEETRTLESVNGNNFISPAQFHEILNERKAERKRKAKEKLEADRKRIEEMKSRVGGVQPVQIFPLEVWKMILNELNPYDKSTMCKLHKMFRKLMQPKMIQDILLPKLIDSEAMTFHYVLKDFDRGHKWIPPTVTYATLRSLSKSVRNAVDNYLENILLKSLRYEITYVPRMNIDLVLGDGDGDDRGNEILKYFLDRDAAGANEKWDFQVRNLQIKIVAGGNSSQYLADVNRF